MILQALKSNSKKKPHSEHLGSRCGFLYYLILLGKTIYVSSLETIAHPPQVPFI